MSPLRRKLGSGIFRFRGPLLVILVLLVTATTAAAISALGEGGIEEVAVEGRDDTEQRVRTMGERCAVPLLDGWSWRPASWTLITPGGTTVGLYETLHGRPLYEDWDETVELTVGRYEDRDDVDVIVEGDDYVRVDFGEDGGISVIKRFDRVGCHLTFSPSSGETRAEEIGMWEAFIDSVERTYPQD